MSQSKLITAALLAAFSLGSLPARADIPAPINPKYQLVFGQDFTKLSTLAVAPHEIGTGTWIAHTPSYQDWFTFQDPGPDGHPFHLDPVNGLSIRVQKDGHDLNHWFSGYSGGLLSSMDGHGKGFAQQYGYFEASMQCPGGPNTWPGFWLLDAPTLTDKTLAYGSEIDITESYGNFGTGPNQTPPGDPDEDGVTWHLWGHNGNPTDGKGIFAKEPGMTTGFHTYGVDMEPDFMTWYFDRREVWRAPTYDAARRPMFVLVNLALGGGTHNNAKGTDYDWTLTPVPSDLKVKYIAVWASPNSPNFKGKPAVPVQIQALPGNAKIKLTWAGGGTGATVYRATKPGGEGATAIASNVAASIYLDTSVHNGTRYYYQVAAVNPFGQSARSPEIAAQPNPTAGATASFVKTDTKTQGHWQGVYGTDGASIFGDKAAFPAYAPVKASTDHTFTWSPTTEARALQKLSHPADHIAAELHSDAPLTFDIDLTDGKPHQIALYFLDYDHKGEKNKVEIKDATFGDTLDAQTFSGFGDGQYGVWTVKGHVQIIVTNAAPGATNSQATVSGLFFGGKAP